MSADGSVTIGEVRSVGVDLAEALRRLGAYNAADALSSAAALHFTAPPEALLELRSALVRTRSEWEAIDDGALVARARRALAGAKRLAIEL